MKIKIELGESMKKCMNSLLSSVSVCVHVGVFVYTRQSLGLLDYFNEFSILNNRCDYGQL